MTGHGIREQLSANSAIYHRLLYLAGMDQFVDRSSFERIDPAMKSLMASGYLTLARLAEKQFPTLGDEELAASEFLLRRLLDETSRESVVERILGTKRGPFRLPLSQDAIELRGRLPSLGSSRYFDCLLSASERFLEHSFNI
jgi:hypothetical protein